MHYVWQLCGLLNLQGWECCSSTVCVMILVKAVLEFPVCYLIKVFKFNLSMVITQDANHWAISMNLDNQYHKI